MLPIDEHQLTDLESIRRFDERAVRLSLDTVDGVTAGDLHRPTPCTGWDLEDLLAHMSAQHRGFAAAAAGQGDELASWRPAATGDQGRDPVADYRPAVEAVMAAFRSVGPATEFRLPEISTTIGFPAAQAIGFHFIDYLVHGWDVAASLGIPYRPDDDLLTAALPIARAVPVGAARTSPGAAFAPPRVLAEAVDPWAEILALLGRNPGWPSP